MASTRSKPLPKVGSAQWIMAEKEQILRLADQEVEEFTFSARNEMEWLNEHMAEVFDENQINLIELFKTPAKLRRKTPHTNRKRNVLEARTPLTEVFATNGPLIKSPSYKPHTSKQIVQFQVAEDPIQDASGEQNDTTKLVQDGKAHTDSGYHGTSDGDMEVDRFLAECDREISMHEEAKAKGTAVHDTDSGSVPKKENQAVDDVPSPSDGSSPVRALVRKSSLTFAALPAREPLANKKSIGGRNQRTSQSEQSKVTATNRESSYGRHSDRKSLGGLRLPQRAEKVARDEDMDVDEHVTAIGRMSGVHPLVEAAGWDLHHKSSTQRLHDKISMLAQSQPTRLTTSIPPITANTMHLDYPELQRPEIATPIDPTAGTTALNEDPESVVPERVNDDKDDWIQPSPQVTPHAKRDFEYIDDGRPFSASRARLQAMLHNARGLFARSANASARAKLETIRDVDTTRARMETTTDDFDNTRVKVETTDDVDMVDVPSTTADSPISMAPPPLPSLEHPLLVDLEQLPQMPKAKDIKRPTKPTKDAVAKTKPHPVSIRVGTLSQRVPLTSNTVSSGLQDSLPAPGPSTTSRQATVTKKPNAPSVPSSASSTTFKRSVSSVVTKPKALLAAERKKEQDAREAQRKLEQKREIERKRAAQQEEARRLEQEQRKEAERLREKARAAVAEDPKRIAQRQAIEQRRLDLNARKAELQQRNIARLGTDLGHALQQERSQPAAAHPRGELGNTKPPSRMNSVQEFGRVAATQALPNAAKPAKRVAEDESSQRPGITRIGALSQNDDTKRRRTGDEDLYDPVTRPTMAPPIRQSNIRKDGPKLSAFPHSYTTAPAAANSAAPAPFLPKPTTNNHFHLYHQQQPQPQQSSKADHPMDMSNRVTGKIPFAETPNPPFPAHDTPQLKQPLPRPATSSPNYGDEDISLPEINTDSEDDDGSDGEYGSLKPKKKAFVPPDWAKSPQLRELLEAQQLVDPATIFGPIRPPNLEKMFPDKERHHRFRQRTSSANWSGEDRLTEEEIRADFVAREKICRQGGWSMDI